VLYLAHANVRKALIRIRRPKQQRSKLKVVQDQNRQFRDAPQRVIIADDSLTTNITSESDLEGISQTKAVDGAHMRGVFRDRRIYRNCVEIGTRQKKFSVRLL